MEKNEDSNVKRDIKTWEILRLLAQKYGETGHYACATEVSNGPGSYAHRRLDFVAVNCWPSEGLKIMAFEIKVSKSDFRHELTDASKHNIFFDEIDNYSIVAPNYVLDDMRIIPPKWGVYHVVRNAEGKLELKTVRKPLDLHDEQMTERRIGRGFMASLVRAIEKRGASQARNLESENEIKERIQERIERTLTNGGRVMTQYDYEDLNRLRKICADLGISHMYGGMSEWERKHFREAKNVADHIRIAAYRLDNVASEVRNAYKSVKRLLDSIDKNGGNPSDALNRVVEGVSENKPETQKGEQ